LGCQGAIIAVIHRPKPDGGNPSRRVSRKLRAIHSVRRLGVEQRFIRAGRPQTNGAIERVQRTILEECWRPTFARSLVPHYTALRRDLADYLGNYNYERAHTGRLVNGRTPAEVVYGARKTRPR
jgi:transposase InsO family protein